jgi:WD40 repeat protein
MNTLRALLSLFVLTMLAGCATPQIQLNPGATAMEVKSKVPVIAAVDFANDGRAVASGAFDGSARIWDLKEAKQTLRVQRPGWAGDITFLPDGKTIAVSNESIRLLAGSNSAETTVWDIRSRSVLRTFPGRLSDASRDGRVSVGGAPRGGSGKVSVTDVQAGRVIREVQGSSVAISPDGRHMAVCSLEDVGNVLFPKFVSSVTVAEVSTGRAIWKATTSCDAVAMSPDGKSVLIAVSRKNNLMADLRLSFVLFDAGTGARIKEFGQTTIPGGFTVSDVFHLVGVVAFSPDGKLAISGDLGARYKIWNLESGTMVRELDTGAELAGTLLNAKPSAKFSPDGRTVVVASLASTRLFDVSTGSQLATMIGFEDGEWLVTTPSGYYNSSEKGDQYLDVSVAGKPYSISQFRESFYRPDLVKAALAGRSLGELRKIADVKPPPSVTIVETPSAVSAEEVAVTLNVADQGGGIGDVRLYRNGTAVVFEKSRNLQVGQAGQRLRYTVRLESGVNAIRAVAFNGDNSMQSSEATITVTASFAAHRPSLHAVVVGIQDFKNPRLKLSYPIADAKLFAETLRSQASALYHSVNVQLYTTPQETSRENLISSLQAMKDKVRPEDLFVFFVASHGTAEEGDYFLITSNVGSISTERLKADALTQSHLKELLSNIPATKKFIVIDTCNAGALGDALQVAFLTRGMTDATAIKILGRAVGSTILSASTSAQEALEGYRGHGLFTYVIAEGLAGKADTNRDGFISTLELAAYVDDRVPVLAEEVFKHAQYPVVSPSGQGFPLGRVR